MYVKNHRKMLIYELGKAERKYVAARDADQAGDPEMACLEMNLQQQYDRLHKLDAFWRVGKVDKDTGEEHLVSTLSMRQVNYNRKLRAAESAPFP